ncbi:MAG TPA: glutamate--tRNA ligase [Ignavibacteria bacterium]
MLINKIMEEVTRNNQVRVRFAPSPTGFLHVGGARTAIFNWLFAKNQKGKFLLRIEDTDPERSKSELSGQILRSMQWLGMDSDEEVVYQSDRITRYKEVVNELVESGKAYYAFETSEELDKRRKESEAKKIAYKYDRASLNLDKNIIEQHLREKRPYAIRFFIPQGVTDFEDIVHGKTTFNNYEIDDFVLIRSDGSPVYQVAVIIDDHDMKISHVIRGDDHLTNTPKQILLYKALGWEIPRFAHLPMILDEGKKKLSKRRDTVSVEEYKELGYLPEALFNFLTLLGYAPPDNREIVRRGELIKLFSFRRVNKKSAVFDIKKLNWINSEYIKSSDENFLLTLFKEYLASPPSPLSTFKGGTKAILPDDDYLLKVISLTKGRVQTINEFYEFGKYFFTDPESYDERGLAKHWTNDIKLIFKEYFETLTPQSPLLEERGGWNSASLEENLRSFAEAKGIKPGQLIHVLRLALTGITASPGIFELMEVLGRDTVVRRIEKFIGMFT